MAQTSFDLESSCDLTDAEYSMYDRKIADRPFDSIHDILRSLSLVEFLLEGRNAPTHMILSRTDGLKCQYFLHLFSHMKIFGLSPKLGLVNLQIIFRITSNLFDVDLRTTFDNPFLTGLALFLSKAKKIKYVKMNLRTITILVLITRFRSIKV